MSPSPLCRAANSVGGVTCATIVPIDQSPRRGGTVPHVTNKHVVAHWMVALNADVSGSTFEAERGQHSDAALVPRLDHRTNLVAVKPIPTACRTARLRKATESSSHPFRVHPPAKIEDPVDFFESRDAGFRTDAEESDQLAAESSPYRPEGVDGLGSLTVEVVHRPRSVVSPVGDCLGVLRCHRTYCKACRPPIAMPSSVAIGTHASKTAARRPAPLRPPRMAAPSDWVVPRQSRSG